MSTTTQSFQPKRDSNLHIRVTHDQLAAIQQLATTAALTPTEWARHQLVRTLATPDAPPQLGLPHAQLFMEYLLTIQALLEAALQHSIPATPPLTHQLLTELLDGLERHKSIAANTLLNRLAGNGTLPFSKG